MSEEQLKKASLSLVEQETRTDDLAPDDWMQEASKQLGRKEQQVLSTSLTNAAPVNPETAAQVKQQAAEVGLDPEVAKRNPQELPKLKAAKTASELYSQKDTPATKRAFQNPDFAEVAHDRVESLSFIERNINAFKKGAANLGVTGEAVAYGIDSLLTALGEGLLPKPKTMTDAEWEWTKAKSKAAGSVVEPSTAGLRLAAETASSIPTDPYQEEISQIIDAEESTLGGVWEGTKYLATHPSLFATLFTEQVPALAAFGPVGGRVGQAVQQFSKPVIERTLTSTAVKKVLEKGVPLASVQFTTNTGLTFGASITEGMTQGLEVPEAITRAGTKAVVEGGINALSAFIPVPQGTTRLGRVGSTLAEAEKQGIFGAMGAAGAAAAVGEDISLSELFLEHFGEFATAPVDLALVTLTNPNATTEQAQQAAKILTDAARAEEAVAVASQLEELGALVQNEDLQKRDPQAFNDFVDMIVEEGAEDVYIEAAKFSEVLEQAGLNPQDVLNELPSVKEQYPEALSTGGDLRIPMGEYVTKIAPAEHHAALADHVRLRPEGMSPAEAAAWQEAAVATFEQGAKERMPAEAVEEKVVKPARQVYDRMVEHLRSIEQADVPAGGLFTREGKISQKTAEGYARLHQAFATVLASKGIDPMAYYGNLFVQGTRPTAPTRESFSQDSDELRQQVEDIERLLAETQNIATTTSESIFDSGNAEAAERAREFRSNFVEKYGDRSGVAAWTEARLDKAISENAYPNGIDTKAKIAFVDPLDFLLATTTLPEEIARETGDLDVARLAEDMDTPFLLINQGQIYGHEGRHRMLALAKAGVTRAPVIMRYPIHDAQERPYAKDFTIQGQPFSNGKSQPLYVSEAFPALESAKDEIMAAMPEDAEVLFQDEIPATIGGIEVEEITDAEARRQFAEELARRVTGEREGGIRTVSGKPPARGWEKNTRISRAGKPIIVYRGEQTGAGLVPENYAPEQLGFATGNPISGLGVFHASERTEARAYGDNVEEFHLDMRKPKIFKYADLPALEAEHLQTIESAQAFAQSLRDEGYDGIVFDGRDGEGFGPLQFVSFDPDQVIRPAPRGSVTLFQDQPISVAQRNDIGLYSGVEQAVLDMKLPGWGKELVPLSDEDLARLDELVSAPEMWPADSPEAAELRALLAKKRKGEPRSSGREIWQKLKSMPGVKKTEIEWLGIEEYLDTKDRFTREEVQAFIHNNGVEIEEVVAAGAEEGTETEMDWQESVWDDPGAWEYRVEDFMYEFDNDPSDLYWFDAESWLNENIDKVVENYESELDAEVFAEVEALVEEGDNAGAIARIEEEGHNAAEDLASEMRDDAEEAANEEAEREYNENPIYTYYDSNTDLYIFGNDDSGYDLRAGGITWQSRIQRFDAVYSIGEAQIQAEDYAREEGLLADERDEGTAQWEEYVMDGYQDNYRELKLTLPEIKDDFYYDVHFPDRNVAAFLRVDDRELTDEPQPKMPVFKRSEGTKLVTGEPLYNVSVYRDGQMVDAQSFDTDEARENFIADLKDEIEAEIARISPKNTYFIEEFQSDWASEARRKGIRTGLDAGELDQERSELNNVIYDKIEALVGDDPGVTTKAQELITDNLKIDEGSPFADLKRPVLDILLEKDQEEIAAIKALIDKRDSLIKASAAERHGVVDFPYKGDAWLALGIKRAIIDAVENDYDAVGWADAQVLADRWSSSYDYTPQYDKKMPSMFKKLTKTEPRHVEGEDVSYWILELTDELKEQIRNEGFSMFQRTEEAARGQIAFGPDITEGPNVISLLEGADLSTFLHESGHFFFEVMRDASTRFPEQTDVRADMDALLSFVGAESLEEWNGMSAEARRDGHEKIARAFEAYLFEGKAPTPGLRKLFDTFAAWLRKVYASLKQLNVELNDEVRRVFDRMLATEEQINIAEQNAEFKPLFATAAEAGMSDEEFAEYTALQVEAHESAIRELEARSLRDMKWVSNAKNKTLKGLQQKQNAARKAIRAEVEAQVQNEPAYRALRFFKKGVAVDSEGNEIQVDENNKLDIDALKTMYPEVEGVEPLNWQSLGYGAYGVLGKEGMHPDMAAEIFGFTSGDELVKTLLDTRPESEVIQGITDQRMIEEHADLVDAKAIEDAANEAIHNEARTRMVATELKAVSKLAALRVIDRQQAKEYAKAAVSKLKVRNTSPFQFEVAERRAAKASAKALAAGETLAAAQAKQDQFLNNELVKEAQRVKQEIDKAVEYLKKFDKPGVRKNLDPDYVDQIDQILVRFDLRKGVALKDIDKRVALRDWVAKQEAEGLVPVIDERLLDEAKRESYKNLSVADLRELRDSIKNIEHLGRLKHKLLTARDQRRFEEIVDDIEASIRDNATRTIKRDIETRTPSDDRKEFLGSWFASHRKLSSLAREMDGMSDTGPMWEYLVRAANERGDFEAVEREKATKRFSELFKPYTTLSEAARRSAARVTAGLVEAIKPEMMQKTYIPEINRSLSKMARLVVALNWGNDDNRQRIMEGYGWDEGQVQAILNTLSEQDWQFVQGAWDFIDEYWEQIAAKEKRVSGVVPQKVEAAKVLTQYGELRGGYFPIKYDDRQSARTTENIAKEQAVLALKGAFSRSTTRRGHTKERAAGGGGQKVRLDFGVMFEHVDQVIHDLTWHEWLVDANRLLGSRRVQEAIYDHYGAPVYRTMKKAVDDIAAGDTPAEMAFERSINWIRTGTSIAGMGWSLWTSLLQPFGLTQGMVRIGPKWVGRGMAAWFGSPQKMQRVVTQIHERSDFMRLRAKTMQREINEIQNRVMAQGVLSPLQDSYFYLIVKAQQVADVPIWLGQYEKAIAENMSEDDAIALADRAVLESQGGGQVKDLADIQRGGPLLKLWTNFYSYFNTTFNLTAESYRGTDFKKPKDVGRFAVDMMLLYTVPATLSALMREALKGECGDDEDCIAEAVVRENLGYMAGTMIGLREFSGFLNGYYGYSGPAGTRFFSESMKLASQAQQGELDAAALKALNNTAGILFHYPAAQVQRTAGGFAALVDGDTENPTALLFGPPRK